MIEHPHNFVGKSIPTVLNFSSSLLKTGWAHFQTAVLYQAFNSQCVSPFYRELIPRSSSGSLFSSPESDWLDVAMVNYGGTFLESEVNELRAMRKVVIFSFLLIPYWMIYTQVKLTK